MYFSRLSLRTKTIPALFKRIGNPYGLHKEIWSMFPYSDSGRDFIYRSLNTHSEPSVFVVSAREPIKVDGIWGVETKSYDPNIDTGHVFKFDLRANPVVSKRDDRGRQHRHDVVMDLKQRKGEASSELTPINCLASEAVGEWMVRKGATGGFRPVMSTLSVDGYHQHRFRKPGGGTISYSTVDIKGALEVTDPSSFRETLYRGIGPAKGFGCGLMLIRRA